MKIKLKNIWLLTIFISNFSIAYNGSSTLTDLKEVASMFGKKKITISVKNIEIQTVIRAFSKQTGINVIIAEGVEGKVSLELKKVNPIDALNAVLETKGYSWYAQDNRTIVATPNKISYTFHLQHTNAEEAVKSLEKIYVADGKIVAHVPTNTIVVEGTTSLIFKIDRALKHLDIIPKQVLIKAKIIELTVGNESNLGMIASYATGGFAMSTVGFAKSTLGAAAADQGLLSTYTNPGINLAAVLNALEKRDDFNLMASPMILAANNREAEILVGEKLGYRLLTTTQSGNTQESIQFLDVGIKLIFTPLISDDGFITLKIHPEVSTGAVVNNVPNSKTTEATTEVTVEDGEVIVIGGLIQEEEREINSGIPFLKDIPILGIPFRGKNLDLKKREIIVFLEPHIVDKNYKEILLEKGMKLEKKYNERRKNNLNIFK